MRPRALQEESDSSRAAACRHAGALTAPARHSHPVRKTEGSGVLLARRTCVKSTGGQYGSAQSYSLRIDVRLTRVPEYSKALNVDVIVAALGSRPIKPAIEGIDGPNVMSAEVAYASPDKAGDNIVVIGGGLAGVEYSIYMTKLGRKVTVVELQDKLTTDESLHTVAMMTQVKELNIDIRLSRSDEGHDKPVSSARRRRVFAADTVVYATGQAPLADEAIDLYDCAPEFYPVGDCIRPKNVMHATHTAFVAAYDIGVI